MSELPTEVVAALDAERDVLNGMFVRQSGGGAKVDQAAFCEHLRESLIPLIEAVHRVLPERTRSVVRPLFEISLELFASRLLGPEAKTPWIARLWRELLPTLPRLLARDPRQVVGCLCNAIFQVAAHPAARTETWLQRMTTLGPQCQSLSEAMQCGAIVAWQAGLAQFRPAALEGARHLPLGVATQSLELPSSTTAGELGRALACLQQNPWMQPRAVLEPSPAPSIVPVGTVGQFRGLGGAFQRPPVVRELGDDLVVVDGELQFRLLADHYGSWFGRHDQTPVSATARDPRQPHIDPRGLVRWGSQTLAQPHLAGAVSQAFRRHTLAITIATSYHVFLFTLRGTES